MPKVTFTDEISVFEVDIQPDIDMQKMLVKVVFDDVIFSGEIGRIPQVPTPE